MSNNFVCHKCLLPIKSDHIHKKSEFEYFHIVCVNNEDLVDITDKFTYKDIYNNENLKLNTKVNKFGDKFIDLSSKEKILEIYKQDKFKQELKNELSELEKININKFNDCGLDNFINELNKTFVNCLITNKLIMQNNVAN